MRHDDHFLRCSPSLHSINYEHVCARCLGASARYRIKLLLACAPPPALLAGLIAIPVQQEAKALGAHVHWYVQDPL